MSTISATTSSASSGGVSLTSGSSVRQLERQKADLQQKIQKEQDSKDDDKAKAVKLAQLNAQLADLEQRISEAKKRQENQAGPQNSSTAGTFA